MVIGGRAETVITERSVGLFIESIIYNSAIQIFTLRFVYVTAVRISQVIATSIAFAYQSGIGPISAVGDGL